MFTEGPLWAVGIASQMGAPDLEDRRDLDTTCWRGALFMPLADVRIREGTHVFTELAESYAERGDPVDLTAELRALGVVQAADGSVTFDEQAPRASVRRSIYAR
jgi:hypothetical protein